MRMFWLSALCAVLFIIVLVLTIKMALMHRALNEICRELETKLGTDTNTLISVSSGDRYIRRHAAQLNVQLRRLRKERIELQNGSTELKAGMTSISHDLRTPLTAILGYLDLLENQDKSEAVARYLSHIQNRAEAMRLLTEELFQYSVLTTQPDRAAAEPVALGSALEESIADFYTAFKERGITPRILMPEEPVIRTLDKAALMRVFGNVLGNALKYSGGDLDISLSPAGEIAFSNIAPGLDEVQTGQLFNRFYTVKTAKNATGLGLAISRALVERMSGTIEARYNGGRLSILIVFL